MLMKTADAKSSEPLVWVLQTARTGDSAQARALAEALTWRHELKSLTFNPLYNVHNAILGASTVSLSQSARESLRRYEDADPVVERKKASVFLRDLNTRLSGERHLFGDRISLADLAIAPFVRQFANTDRAWFGSQDWSDLIKWLERFLESDRFAIIFSKYEKWHAGDKVTVFP